MSLLLSCYTFYEEDPRGHKEERSAIMTRTNHLTILDSDIICGRVSINNVKFLVFARGGGGIVRLQSQRMDFSNSSSHRCGFDEAIF